MAFFDFIRSLYNSMKTRPINDGVVEKAFDVVPAVSRTMQDNISLWYALYINQPPWITQDNCVKPLGLPGAIGRELARYALAEFNFTVSGGPRAEYLDERMHIAENGFLRDLELGLCLGGVAFRPYIERGQLFVDANSATVFSPIEFDGSGRAVSGVFKDEITYNKQKYTRLEYHGFEHTENGNSIYVIRNKAYKGDAGGTAIALAGVPAWSDLQEEITIEGVDRPLFAYFRNPSSNDIEPDSQVGVSVYGGNPNIGLIQQADEQWERLWWEFQSGERKIFTDATKTSASAFKDRLFEYGSFTADGNLFEPFSPEFRNDPLYQGFQYILQRIEYNVGLSFGTISDPQNVEKTATEILAAKNRQRITVKAIQNALEATFDGLIYAMNVYCDLYGLAPAGEYEVTYNWGDGVLDDPDTIRQDKAMDVSLVSAGLMNDWEYRMKWYGETEDEAKAMLPKMQDIVTGVSVADLYAAGRPDA